MLTLNVFNRQGEPAGTVEVDPADFGGKINKQLLHDVVLMYEANQRAGTHSTLRRGEVAGSTKKLFRQKGTGNARAGTLRTNKRRGGGTAKGPKPRDYSYTIPKKAVRAATRMAILSKLQDQEAIIIDDLVVTEVKTKPIAALFKALKRRVQFKLTEQSLAQLRSDGVPQTVLEKLSPLKDKEFDTVDNFSNALAEKLAADEVVAHQENIRHRGRVKRLTYLIGTADYDMNLYKSARNIDGVQVMPTSQFNAYVVLKQKRLVLTKAALEQLRKKNQTSEKPAQ
jgi:large subunit ribosomal protein L4